MWRVYPGHSGHRLVRCEVNAEKSHFRTTNPNVIRDTPALASWPYLAFRYIGRPRWWAPMSVLRWCWEVASQLFLLAQFAPSLREQLQEVDSAAWFSAFCNSSLKTWPRVETWATLLTAGRSHCKEHILSTVKIYYCGWSCSLLNSHFLQQTISSVKNHIIIFPHRGIRVVLL